MRSFLAASILAFGSFKVSAQLDTSIIQYWHYALCKNLNLGNQLFRISQGSISVGTSSTAMWNIFNAASSSLSKYYYQPSQSNNFSSSYGMILFNLSGANTNCNLTSAITDYINANKVYAWDKQINALTSGLASAGPLSFYFDTVVFDTSSISVDTALTLLYKVNEMNIHFVANYQHYLIFNSRPFSQDSKTSLPNIYNPWYSSCALATAYDDTSFPLWSSSFGSNGFMKYIISSLVVVSGKEVVSVSATSKTTLYSKTVPGAHPDANQFSFQKINSDSLTYSNSTTNDTNNPLLLGVIYNTIDDFIKNTGSN